MKKHRVYRLVNDFWQADVSLYGGQLLNARWAKSAHPVIFPVKNFYSHGTPLRGGAPICWPWFGASPAANRPMQGFARTAEWEIAEQGRDFIKMFLPEENIPVQWREFHFELFSEVQLADDLHLKLTMKNCSDVPVKLSCALHTYFAVSDCEKISVRGLEKTPFTIKGGPEHPGENHTVQIRGEVCRLYYPQTGRVIIFDPEWQRQIVIEKINSASTLLWNPGAERCAQIADLSDDAYRDFVCIEANRAGNDDLILAPAELLTLTQSISLCRLG